MDLELLKKACQQLNLGTIKCQPVPLKGGFMHKIYSLFTTKRKYVIKLLNPYIMKREAAMKNYNNAEKLEIMLEQHNIPIIPALVFNRKKMQEIDGKFFYLYEWFEGKTLKSEEIKEIHCYKIAKFLAHIHKIDKQEMTYSHNEIHADWDFYIKQMSLCNDELYHLLKENRCLLYESQENSNLAIKKISPIVSICHNDMDSKNVLWNGNNCRIIDLECLSYASPFIETYEMALSWSGYESCNIDFILFKKVIQSYAETGGQLPTDWETIYDSNYGKLEWLEYNIRRSLGIDCSEKERKVAISEVQNIIFHIVYYLEAKSNILNCLYKLNV